MAKDLEYRLLVIPIDFRLWLRTKGLKILVGIIVSVVVVAGIVGVNHLLVIISQRKADEFIDTGGQALANLRYGEALTCYLQALDYDPSRYEAYMSIAHIYRVKNEFEQAEQILLQGLKGVDEIEDVNFNLGDLALEVRDYQAAVEYFLGANQDQLDVKRKLVETYLQLGEINKAKEKIEEMLDLDDQDAWVHYYQALIESLDKLEKGLSEVSLAKDLSLGKSSIPINDRSTRLKTNLENAQQAETAPYQSTLLGFALLQEGYPRLALITLEEVVKEKPEYRDAQALLGAVYLELKEYPSAETSLKKSVEIDPNYAYGYYLLGQCYSQTSKGELAKEFFQTAIIHDSSQLSYFDAYLSFLNEQDDYSTVETVLNQIVGSDNYGDSQKEKYETQLAYLYLDQLGKLQEGMQLAQKYKGTEVYAWALYKNEQPEAALAVIEGLLKERSVTWLYYRQGKIQTELGQIAEARESFDRALDLDTEGEVTNLINQK